MLRAIAKEETKRGKGTHVVKSKPPSPLMTVKGSSRAAAPLSPALIFAAQIPCRHCGVVLPERWACSCEVLVTD